MSSHNPEYEFNPTPSERLNFSDKFRELLPGVEFEEPAELLEARTAVLQALAREDQQSNFLQSVWIEYAKICEQIIDNRIESSPQIRAQLQIAILIHKALIFREAENIQRYGEDLNGAEEYAYNMHLDEIVEAIGTELDKLAS